MIFKDIFIEFLYMFAPRKRLEYYVRHNNVAKVERLLKNGADPNPTKRQIRNAALKSFYPLLFKASRCPSADMLKILLDNNANPYATYCRMKFYGQEWYSFDFEDVGILEYFLEQLRSPFPKDNEQEAQKNLKLYILLRAHWDLDDKLQKWVFDKNQEYSPSSFSLFQQWEDELLLHQQRERILENIVPSTKSTRRRM